MKSIKDKIYENFYGTIKSGTFQEWYKQNDRLVRSKHVLLIDKNTNELIIKYKWNAEQRVSLLKYFEWIEDYIYSGAIQTQPLCMEISWVKNSLSSTSTFKVNEFIKMIVDKENNTLTLSHTDSGRNYKVLYKGEI